MRPARVPFATTQLVPEKSDPVARFAKGYRDNASMVAGVDLVCEFLTHGIGAPVKPAQANCIGHRLLVGKGIGDIAARGQDFPATANASERRFEICNKLARSPVHSHFPLAEDRPPEKESLTTPQNLLAQRQHRHERHT
jgi:hypothetical protein